MSDEPTNKLPDAASFEQRVMMRFDAMDSFMRQFATETNERLERLEAKGQATTERLDRLEAKSYDTKPIWERALAELLEVKRELREVITRLDRMDARTLESRADVRELQDRVDSLERKAS